MRRTETSAGAIEPSTKVVGRPHSATPTPERQELGRHLGSPPERLDGMSDSDVEEAMRRISALMERISALEARAVHDDLTGVLRRGAGLDALRLEFARVRRAGQPISVAFLDVDGLKRVNDSRGHTAGDDLLCAVAATLRRRLRATDLVIRHGGDEFLCVLPGAALDAAEGVMAEVSEAIREATGGATVSFGLASVDAAAEPVDPGALVGCADLDLYRRRAERSRHPIAG
jgi:diguanylate cyclase (GGDEF)-like protein